MLVRGFAEQGSWAGLCARYEPRWRKRAEFGIRSPLRINLPETFFASSAHSDAPAPLIWVKGNEMLSSNCNETKVVIVTQSPYTGVTYYKEGTMAALFMAAYLAGTFLMIVGNL